MVHPRYNFTVLKIRAAKDRERDRLLEIPLEFQREQTSRYILRFGVIPRPYEEKIITSAKQSYANICFLIICELFHSLGKLGKKSHQSLTKLSSAGGLEITFVSSIQNVISEITHFWSNSRMREIDPVNIRLKYVPLVTCVPPYSEHILLHF